MYLFLINAFVSVPTDKQNAWYFIAFEDTGNGFLYTKLSCQNTNF